MPESPEKRPIVENLYVAVVLGKLQFRSRLVETGGNVVAEAGTKWPVEIRGPESYSVFLVNASARALTGVDLRTGGFEGEVQLNVMNKQFGALTCGRAILLEDLDFELLDFALWYAFDLAFGDGARMKAGFTIMKSYALKADRMRHCPILGLDAYHFDLELRS